MQLGPDNFQTYGNESFSTSMFGTMYFIISTPFFALAGTYALPYLMTPDPRTCWKRVAGMVTVAVGSTDIYSAAQYHKCEVRDGSHRKSNLSGKELKES